MTASRVVRALALTVAAFTAFLGGGASHILAQATTGQPNRGRLQHPGDDAGELEGYMADNRTLWDARAFLARMSPGDCDGAFIHAGHVDRYREVDDDDKARYHSAMLTLLSEGAEWEKGLAASFFKYISIPVEVMSTLVRSYEGRGWDSGHPAAGLFARSSHEFSDEQVASLRRLFLSDPERHRRLLQGILPRDPTGPLWDAFVELVTHVMDIAGLLDAFETALLARRDDDFFELLRGKPEPLVRALANRLTKKCAERLRDVLGLRSEP